MKTVSLWLKGLKSWVRGLWLKGLGPCANGVFVEAPWGLMLLDPRDGHVSRQFLRNGVYKPEEVDFLKHLLRDSDRMLIIGGHIGGVAIPLSRFVSTLDVIEASPSNYRLLIANLMLASAQNVTCHQWAASDRNGEIKFLMSSENSGGSKRAPAYLEKHYTYDSPTVVTVPAYRLEEKFSDPFDVILMDIEGSEFFAIQGGKNLISNCRVFIFEFIPDHIRNVAGINLSKFLETLPLEHFQRAILPRNAKNIPIIELRAELERLYRVDGYEDGVILVNTELL